MLDLTVMPEQRRRAAAAARGWMPEEQGLALYDAAREQADRGLVLEIGSYCGKSAVYLASGAAETGGVVVAIDHHRGSSEHQPGEYTHDPDLFDPVTGGIDTLPGFRATIAEAGLEDHVVPVVGPSATVATWWRSPLAMLLIDGSHHLQDAVADFNGWAHWVMPGGLLAIHDIYPAPRERWQEGPHHIYRLALSGDFSPYRAVDTLRILRRAEHA
ncbi:MAG: class I SAM-dependent methyltransferase [Frankia sp.]